MNLDFFFLQLPLASKSSKQIASEQLAKIYTSNPIKTSQISTITIISPR